jgi:hypothetical protein
MEDFSQNPGPLTPGSGKEKGGLRRPLLIGCGCIVAFLVIAVGGGCGFLYFKGKDVMVYLMEESKPELMSMVTEAHSEKQREQLSNCYDSLIKAMEEHDFMPFMEKYETQFRELQLIMSDEKITVSESRQWRDNMGELCNGGDGD